ncbi:methyltransferase, FkbM family [Burkholderia sp. D7]|nr:methyltransferase, FkbM family [Burkholderia sp. D7]
MAEAHSQAQASKPSLLKRAARRVARCFYRIALPVLRPLAFRTRRYLTQGLQDQSNHSLALTQGVKDELGSLRHEVHCMRQELQRAHQELHRVHDELRHTHAEGLKVLQKTAGSLQHEVLVNAHHWHTVRSNDAQALAAGLHQSIQASRELLRDDVLRSHEDIANELQAAGKARELLRDDVLRSHEDIANELQAAGKARELLRDDVLRSHEDIANELQAAGKAREVTQVATQGYVSNSFSRLDHIEELAKTTARRVAMHADDDMVLVKSEMGYVLCSDSDHAVLAGLLDSGELERGARHLIQRFLKPGDVFVDVGAHLGLLSLAAARAMQGQGKIFAFEPFPRTRGMLEKSFWINGYTDMIEVYDAAVSNHIGETDLFLGATSGHHSIFELAVPKGHPKHQITVPVVTLDSALPAGQAVNLLKIDAEGAELNIIEGARLLQSNNPDIAMIVELGPSHLKRVGHSLERWLGAFSALGFVYRAINPDTGALENASAEELALIESSNLFFARPDSCAWKQLDGNA